MNREQSVPFQLPDDPDDRAEVIAAVKTARLAGRIEAMLEIIEFLADTSNKALRVAALRHIANPREKTVTQIANALYKRAAAKRLRLKQTCDDSCQTS